MKRSEILFGILRIPVDAVAVFAALLLSYRLRAANVDLIPGVQFLEPAQTLPSIPVYIETFVQFGILAFVLIAGAFSLYALQTTRSAWSEVGRIIVASLVWLTVVIGWYFLVRKQLFYSRVLLVHSGFFVAIFAIFGRAAITVLQRGFLRLGYGVRSVVSIGSNPIVASAKLTLTTDVHYKYLGHIESFSDLQKTAELTSIDLVVQTDANPGNEETNTLIEYCRSEHLGYAFLPPVLADNPHLLTVDHLGMVPMLRFTPTPLDGWGRILKRVFDVLVSIIALIVLLPFLLIVSLIIVLDSGLPVFYVSKRVGEQARMRIPVIKFRTMIQDADAQKDALYAHSHRSDGPLFKIKNDPRVTRFGKFLRRFSIDELPQLINVISGHMSLVGPRPHLPEEVNKYSSYQRRVFAVKPGITGLAQVYGRSDLKFEEEVRLDLQYIEEWSPFLDLWILWRTVFIVLSRHGAD